MLGEGVYSLGMTHENHKKELETMLAALEGELKEIGIHNPENPSDWIAVPPDAADEPDPIDVADTAEEWEERRSTVALLETRYNNIRRALKKIEEGTYGICEVSGEPIEEERLAANPAARTCIAHKDDEATLPL